MLKNPALKGREVCQRRMSARQNGPLASCGEDRRREGDELRQFAEAIARQASKRTRTRHGFVEAKLGSRIMSLKAPLGRVEKGEIDSRRQGLLREYAALGQNRFVRAPTARAYSDCV
jgi:hypothetical protein